MTAPQMVLCRRCKTRFERKRRGAMPKYCSECRVIVNRERANRHDEGQRLDIASKQARLREILEPMRDTLTGDMILTAEEFINAVGRDRTGAVPVVNDQQPAGTSSPSGSDDGTSTYHPDIVYQLESRRIRAVMDDWQADNPQWWSD